MDLPVFKCFDQVLNLYEIEVVCGLFCARICCQDVSIEVGSIQELSVLIHVVPFFVDDIFVKCQGGTVVICGNADCIGCIYDSGIIDSDYAVALLSGLIQGTGIAFV